MIKKPAELDLDLDRMRAEVTRTLVENMRNAVREYDEIEALSRLLNRANGTSNGNGTGRHAADQGGEPAARRNGAGSKPRLVDGAAREALLAKALEVITAAGPAGISHGGMVDVVPEEMFGKALTHTSRSRILFNLLRGAAANSAISRRAPTPSERVNGATTMYTPAAAVEEKASAAPAAADSPAAAGRREGGVAALVRQILAARGGYMTAAEIRHSLAPSSTLDGKTLYNRIYAALGRLVKTGAAQRRDFADGVQYAVKRSSLRVSKAKG